VFFPLWLPLILLWFLLSSPRITVLIEVTIVSIALYLCSSADSGAIHSFIDVLLLTVTRGFLLGFVSKTPEKIYPSVKRRLFSCILTLAIVICLLQKLQTVSGHVQIVILTSLIGNIITCISEHWVPTSLAHLTQSEDNLLASAGVSSTSLVRKFACGISYFESAEIEEVAIVTSDSTCKSQIKSKPVLVLTHGYGAGKAIWASIIPELQKTYHLYILDWNGIGMSSRPKFSARRLSQAEGFFVNSLENWRVAVGLDRFFLCAHSLGGYLSSIYALRYPQHVQQLILLSPVVGVPEDLEQAEHTPFSLFNKIFSIIWNNITPMYFVRFLGPLSFIITDKVIRFRFGDTVKGCELGALAAYLYHLAVGPPSGELALPLLLAPGAHPHRPLSPLLGKIELPTVFIYGEHDWMDCAGGKKAVQLLQENHKDAQYFILPEAGHQLMFENPQGLCRLLLDVTARYV